MMIAPWKIHSSVEAWLGKRADASYAWRGRYVDYYRVQQPEYYQNGLRMVASCIDKFEHDADADRRQFLATDMIYSLHRFGFMFDEYFWFGLEKLNAQARKEFVSDKIRYQIYGHLNTESGMNALKDKWKTFLALKPHFKREAMLLESDTEFEEFEAFCEEHPAFLVKPLTSNCGKGIAFYSSVEGNELHGVFDSLKAVGESIVEEQLVQDDRLGAFHPESINTVRVPTIIDTQGGAHIIAPFFRMGCGKSRVDNAGAGGVFASIDVRSGICTAAVDESGGEYLCHPDTGQKIVGFSIPRWNEAMQLAKELISKLDGVRYVGWDLALTSDGWAVVEGNSMAQFVAQIADKRGRMKEFLEYAYGPNSSQVASWFGEEAKL